MNPREDRAGRFPDRSIRTVGLSLLAAFFLALGALHAVADPGNGHGNGPPGHADGNGRPEWANGNGPAHKHASPTPTPSADHLRSPDAAPAPVPQPAPVPATAEPSSDPGPGRPGNNGTVKVDGTPFDEAPNNEPHVGCRFEIDFYGYDRGALDATYRLELWPPTRNGVLAQGSTFIGQDRPGGGTDLDASVRLDLETALAGSGAEPHPIQGFHVRLTVHAQGSVGADVKHKTFWVRCVVRRPAPAPTTTPPPVMPSTFTPSPPLAFTGADSVRWAGAALLLLLLGSGLLWLGRNIGEEPSR